MQDENLPICLPRLAVYGQATFLQIKGELQAAVLIGSLEPGDIYLCSVALTILKLGQSH